MYLLEMLDYRYFEKAKQLFAEDLADGEGVEQERKAIIECSTWTELQKMVVVPDVRYIGSIWRDIFYWHSMGEFNE